jgi:hypothetical protein
MSSWVFSGFWQVGKGGEVGKVSKSGGDSVEQEAVDPGPLIGVNLKEDGTE